ncbi:SGNH/GDSL hydrolase family protein [Paenibacillus xylaniclasticus]|uniref:SGNH/GDSL hydrolase family protein n=1 Tax=Paenibacillus xylaniclasticus TaxID=588083 RepID=UPI000FDB715E|nr:MULTISPECIES: SGNH/GDSL hydrolase family protein [Paenibacillus]GFN31475.1 spore germination lipase LipC [Paenibacillus curdlanolyticus]
MEYLALGDSITFGHDWKTKLSPFPIEVQTLLEESEEVSMHMHAKPGWTSDRLLQSISRSKDRLCEDTRLVTLIIGGNDVIKYTLPLLTGKTTGLYRIAERLSDNIRSIVSLVAHPRTTVLIGTLYNPFPNWIVMEKTTQIINQHIRRLIEWDNVHLLDLEHLFKGREWEWIDGYNKGRFLDLRPIGNPIHPNLNGHQAIAEEVVRTYKQIIQTRQNHSREEGALVS